MSRQGFTLVEMLVALVIFALLAAGGAAVLSFTVDNQAIVAERLERVAAFERARVLMTSDLTQLAGRGTRDQAGVRSAAFTAQGAVSDGVFVEFVRRGWENVDASPRASLQQVQYALVEGRIERRARAMLDGVEYGPPLTLLTGVGAARISVGDQTGWRQMSGLFTGPPPRALRLAFDTEAFGTIEFAFLGAAS